MNNIKHAITAIAAFVAASASRTTYAGGVTASVGWVVGNEEIAIGGFVLAVFGFAVNLYFKIKEDRRQQAMHLAQMAEVSARMQDARQSRARMIEPRG